MSSDAEDIADLAITEGRNTLDKQLAAQSDIDNKASRLLRINTIVLGVLLSGISFLVNNDVVRSEGHVFNFYLSAGIVFLLGSIAFAAITYSASDSYVGISESDILELIDNDYNSTGSKEGVAEAYGEWISFNSDSLVIDAFYFTVTTNLLIWGLTFLTLGFTDAISHRVRISTVGVIITALIIFTYSTEVFKQFSKWCNVVEPLARVKGSMSRLVRVKALLSRGDN